MLANGEMYVNRQFLITSTLGAQKIRERRRKDYLWHCLTRSLQSEAQQCQLSLLVDTRIHPLRFSQIHRVPETQRLLSVFQPDPVTTIEVNHHQQN